MKQQKDSAGRAGFWIRLCAGLLDLGIVTAAVYLCRQIAVGASLYIPFELAVLLCFPLYSILLLGWTGQTVGMWCCGLLLSAAPGGRPSRRAVVLRETLGRLLCALPLGLGFAWGGLGRRKRPWHDALSGISVQRRIPRPRLRIVAAATIALAGAAWALGVPTWIGIAREAHALKPASAGAPPFEGRNPNLLQEAAKMDEAKQQVYAVWLREHAVEPVAYAVQKAKKHDVLVFGEVHEKREALAYLNRLIPVLYREAGVTRVAMEVCLAEDNEALARLVTAEVFDREAALALARHQPWGVWGWKGYWDVFETVWRLNRTIPETEPKVLVVGLDERMDMPSIGMLGLEDNPAKNCPVWEKLRIVRLPRLVPHVAARDLFMARSVEREVLEPGHRAVVWVGRQHALASPQPVGPGGLRASRMGAMLRARYGERIFFIHLHGYDIPASLVDPAYTGARPAFGPCIESIVAAAGQEAVGFDTDAAPFGLLRDEGVFEYHFEPRLALQDLTDGYVYLVPWKRYTECAWLPDYVSPHMFAGNRPFYQAFGHHAGRTFANADDVNRFFQGQ